MNEFEIIKAFFHRESTDSSIVCGIGDDCAVVLPPKGQNLVMSIDTHVAGCHFPEDADANLIASRALHCAVSDLAAMGAEPLWFTLALTLPSASTEWLTRFSEGLFECAKHYGIALIGGDTTRGPLTLSIQVQGAVPEKSTLLRSGASAGDQIFVTGTLGDGRAGLDVVQGRLEVDAHNAAYFHKKFYQPEARVRSGLLLRYLASSCIDVSDGLLADLGHLCQASGLGAQLDASKIPLSPALLASVPTRTALDWALTGGDDYQLCFTANKDNAERLKTQARSRVLDVTWIGEMVEGRGITDVKTGKKYSTEKAGFAHF